MFVFLKSFLKLCARANYNSRQQYKSWSVHKLCSDTLSRSGFLTKWNWTNVCATGTYHTVTNLHINRKKSYAATLKEGKAYCT